MYGDCRYPALKHRKHVKDDSLIQVDRYEQRPILSHLSYLY